MKYDFLGVELKEAERILKRDKQPYSIVRYVSYRPYTDADSTRVLRMRFRNGIYELVVGEFITNVRTSQG